MNLFTGILFWLVSVAAMALTAAADWCRRHLDHGMMAAGVPRSGKWPKVRGEYLQTHPYCEVCGAKHPDVHHVESYSRRPDLEIEPSNLISLGRECGCHELFGHLKRWESENPNCRKDVAEWNKKIQERP